MSEEYVFILLGRWLRLHYEWQGRLPALADILCLPVPTAEADPAIRRQHTEACAEIQAIREQAHRWGLALESELSRIHFNYSNFADAFRRCHAAYEPWIARLVTPGSLPADQLASALEHAAEVTQDLNLSLRLRLGAVHPVPNQDGTGVLAVCFLIGGGALSVAVLSPLPVLLAVGCALLVAWLGDTLSGHAKAVARQKRFKDLIAG